ncbi:MAG: hypothetical protein HRU09_13265 [Oligoflexales bacterium]|nr:hypothetical protein [Oligoflexales bacterium]
MLRNGQTLISTRVMIVLFFVSLYGCANESSQSSAPRQRSTETSSSKSQSNNAGSQQVEDSNQDQSNPLDNRESTAAKQARLVREAETCLEEDKIKEVEIIVTGNIVNPIDVTNKYTSGTLFEDAKAIAKKVEEEIDPENPPTETPRPPNGESTTEDGVKVSIYKQSVQSAIPTPIFKFSLTGASTDSGVKVDLDEATYPLLNGYAQKIRIPYEGNLGISDLAKVFISKKKNILQVSNPFESSPIEEQIIKLEELYIRQILKVTLRVNGKKIYEADDINHVIALHSGGDDKLNYSPEWADVSLSQNKVYQEYSDSFKECIAPLEN